MSSQMCSGLFFPSMLDLFRKKLFLFHEINPDCIHQILMKKEMEDDQLPIKKEEDDQLVVEEEEDDQVLIKVKEERQMSKKKKVVGQEFLKKDKFFKKREENGQVVVG